MRLTAYICVLCVVHLPLVLSSSEHSKTLSGSRSPKFSLFTVVKFDNAACTTLTAQNGTCYTQTECTSLGGTTSGSCAIGFGVCCFFSYGCSSTTNLNNTYFTGLSTLGTGAGFCQHTISKISTNVCQIRLDFDSFSLSPPLATGVCTTDKFIVTGASSSVPTICGSNTGQHIYINSGTSLSPITLTISTTGTFATRGWNIRSSQICCGAINAAPEGCLQYYTGASGTVTSFNYGPGNTGQHLASQSYSICFRKEQGFCGICYSMCSTTAANGAFSIHGAASGSVIDNNCGSDFVRIPCGQATTTFASTCAASKYCGNILASAGGAMAAETVCSYLSPFVLGFFTTADEANDIYSSGFCLNYNQQPC